MVESVNIQTAWLLTTGSYSDYSVTAVFATEEAINHVIAIDVDGGWNEPEACQVIHDPGVPLDVLHLRLYRGDYGYKDEDGLRVHEKHELQWPWQQWGTTPPVEGEHLTLKWYHEDVERRRGYNYSRPADHPSWVNRYPIARASGTDHAAVRKAFSEHRSQALVTLDQAGISWTQEPA